MSLHRFLSSSVNAAPSSISSSSKSSGRSGYASSSTAAGMATSRRFSPSPPFVFALNAFFAFPPRATSIAASLEHRSQTHSNPYTSLSSSRRSPTSASTSTYAIVSSSPGFSVLLATTSTLASSTYATSQLGSHEWFSEDASGNTAAPRIAGNSDVSNSIASSPFPQMKSHLSSLSSSSASSSLSPSLSSSLSSAAPSRSAFSSSTRLATRTSRSRESHRTTPRIGPVTDASPVLAPGVVTRYRVIGFGTFTVIEFICAAPHRRAKPSRDAMDAPETANAGASLNAASPKALFSVSSSAGHAASTSALNPSRANSSLASS